MFSQMLGSMKLPCSTKGHTVVSVLSHECVNVILIDVDYDKIEFNGYHGTFSDLTGQLL